MPWSSAHRGDYDRMRRNLTVALLEAESFEPRIQLDYSQGRVEAELVANVGLLRLLLERADRMSRIVFNQGVGEHYHVNDSTFSDRQLADSA